MLGSSVFGVWSMGKVVSTLVSCLLIKFKTTSQIPHECHLSLDSGIFSILEDVLVSPCCVCKRITLFRVLFTIWALR